MKISDVDVLKLFANNISQFVFWKDVNSVYQGCNMNFANYAGFNDPNEIIGKTDYDLPWSKEEADFFVKIDKQVMRSGQAQLNYEETQTLSDGKTRWISTSKIPLMDKSKKSVIGILGWYIDITSYKEMQIHIDKTNETLLQYSQQLENSSNKLAQANYDMEMFTYAVSHDLKSPIRSIVSFTGLILKSHCKQLESKIIEKLNIILNSGKNMNNLVHSILNYAKSGMKNEVAEKVNLKKLLAEKISDLDQLLLKENSHVKIDFPDIEIMCYPELLGIVLYNLISNGLKYNESKSQTVVCSVEPLADKIVFSINDNGIGVSPEFHETIFKPFKRLHSSKIQGSGLGLSICKRIVELHNGHIWIESTSDAGTNIKFSISKQIKE